MRAPPSQRSSRGSRPLHDRRWTLPLREGGIHLAPASSFSGAWHIASSAFSVDLGEPYHAPMPDKSATARSNPAEAGGLSAHASHGQYACRVEPRASRASCAVRQGRNYGQAKLHGLARCCSGNAGRGRIRGERSHGAEFHENLPARHCCPRTGWRTAQTQEAPAAAHDGEATSLEAASTPRDAAVSPDVPELRQGSVGWKSTVRMDGLRRWAGLPPSGSSRPCRPTATSGRRADCRTCPPGGRAPGLPRGRRLRARQA